MKYLLYYLSFINTLSFLFYGIDKYKVFYTLKDLTTSNIEKIFECKINDIVNNFIKYINENN